MLARRHTMMSPAANAMGDSSDATRVGAELRETRERLGWSLADVAGNLRIRYVYLSALEEGRVADLPGIAYAVGFLARPLGGLFFSHFGDRLGRKWVLVTTLLFMGGATMAIGLLPTFEQIGVWAPVLLVLCRFFQGFGAGAEQSGGATLLTETAPDGTRGRFSSLIMVGAALGTALGALVWIGVQTLLMGIAIGIHWSPRPAFLLTPPYLGFQILAFLAFSALEREARGREELARTNAELRSARELLAQSSRVAERLRIARELHDAVGHRLVALSLNLEVASHRVEGPALEPIQVAQSLNRQVLTDIGEIVDALGRAQRLDLRRALEAMTEEIPRPRVHLRLPENLAVEDAGVAHLLLRCCQEIVTNAAKHAGADNLWLDVTQEDGAIEVKARDDGRGAQAITGGRGLAGMRERLESAGGSLEVVTQPGMGFAVAALVPVRRGV